MKIDKKQTLKLLDEEITWCMEHPSTNLSKEFQKGFKSGLKQAIELIDFYEEER